MQPLITVIIPAFNAEKYISKCMESVLRQTYKNLEIIAVDDGSSDGTSDLLKTFAVKDARIKVISQKNAGPGAARNRALDMASGDYLGFVDADDYIAADMYETLYGIALKYSADIVCCNLSLDYGSNIKQFVPVREGVAEINKEKALAYAVNEMSFGSFLCNKLFKADLFKNFRITENTFYEDYDAGMRLLAAADIIYYIDKNMYFYVQTNPASTTHVHNIEKTIDHYKVSKVIFDFCGEKGFKEAAVLARIRLLDVAITLLKARPDKALYQEACATVKRDLRFCLNGNIKLRKKIFALAALYIPFSFERAAWLCGKNLRKL